MPLFLSLLKCTFLGASLFSGAVSALCALCTPFAGLQAGPWLLASFVASVACAGSLAMAFSCASNE